MSSSRRTSKPPRPFESLASLKAAKKTYCSIDYQIECLNELYNQLMPQNSNRRANSSSRAQDDSQRDPKVLQQLRELKANLRSNYGNPRLFPPLERLKVVVMFDDHKKAFFDIRLRPLSGYPTGYPFLIDDSEGSIVGLSEAIYQEVLKAVQEEEEEEEEERDRDEGHNNNNSHAAEDFLDPVNIKQEVVDEEEEEEELITLDDDSDEDESLNNELQQEESYNSQVNRPQSPENNAVPESEDLIVSAISAAASSSSVPAIVPPENGSPAVNPQATDTNTTNTTSSSSNTAEQQRQRRQQEQSVSQGHSETVPIKLEPAGSSTVTIIRRGRPPSNRAPRTGHNEAPTAAGAASVAVPPAHAAAAAAAVAANSRLLQVNSQTTITKVFLSQSKPQQQQQQLPPPSHHSNNNNNNNGTAPSAQQRQQQPPAAAAAAAVTACGTLTMRPTENSSIFHIVGSKRPADNLNAAQPSHSQPAQGNPKRAKVSAVSSPLVSRPSAAAADKRRAGVLAAATASTTSAPSTTSTPSTASTSQQQHHQQHRQRPSTSTAIALAAVTAANVEDYLRAHCPSYFSVKDAQTKVQCPDCPKSMIKYQLKDHLLWVHHGLRPYHCQLPGCGFTTGWKNSAANHAKNVHNGSYPQYIVYREE